MGIGGGIFLVIHNASTGKTEVIDAREVAPLSASKDMFKNNSQLANQGGLAIAVPGEIRGYALAHKRHGQLPWSRLFQEAIELAETGVKVGRALAGALIEKETIIESTPSFCEVFCNKNGKILKENDIVKYPKLANTFRIISEDPDAFYTGTLASDIVDDISKAGGIITLKDLKNYETVLVENPDEITLGDYKIISPPAPGSGAVLALILNILKGYNITRKDFDNNERKALTYYRIVEAFKFAFAKRTELGDPKFLNITELVKNMTSPDFAEHLRRKINDSSTQPLEYYEPSFVPMNDAGTSHMAVLTKDGSAVSATSTINSYFGAKVRSSSLGIIYNDEMDDFSSPYIINSYDVYPSSANFIKPGKRPLSSMVPTIIVDKRTDRVKMVVGASGGTKITTATALVIIHALWFKHDVGISVEQARLHNQLMPNATKVEPGMDKVVIDGLLQRGGQVSQVDALATVQAIVCDGDWIHAASDSRKGGLPAGY
uniref:glutathione hydrolase 1 proenzyme isoform X1 n=1 Tax=Myxine glutinosa TaxID=7769 RepID=UPI00358ECECC